MPPEGAEHRGPAVEAPPEPAADRPEDVALIGPRRGIAARGPAEPEATFHAEPRIEVAPAGDHRAEGDDPFPIAVSGRGGESERAHQLAVGSKTPSRPDPK